MKATVRSMPSSNDIPFRWPANVMMPLQPPATHASTSSCSFFSISGHCSFLTSPSLMPANDIGPIVGTRPYFFSVGQSAGPTRSKP